MAREDNFTSTVDGAAAHAAMFEDHDWDDAPDPADLLDDPHPTAYTPAAYAATPRDPWATGAADTSEAPF